MQIRARPWLDLSPAEMHLSAGIVVIVLLVVGIVFNIFRVSVQIRARPWELYVPQITLIYTEPRESILLALRAEILLILFATHYPLSHVLRNILPPLSLATLVRLILTLGI